MSWLLKDEGPLGRFELEKEIEEHIEKLVTEARAAIAKAKQAEEDAKMAAQLATAAHQAVAQAVAQASNQGWTCPRSINPDKHLLSMAITATLGSRSRFSPYTAIYNATGHPSMSVPLHESASTATCKFLRTRFLRLCSSLK